MQFSWFVVTGALLGLSAGCGSTNDPPVTSDDGHPPKSGETHRSEAPSRRPGSVPVSTVSMTKPLEDPQTRAETPNQIATWALDEIKRLRAASNPDDPGAVAAYRRVRNRQIVDLATQAMSATHTDSTLADQFNAAVHQLMEAQLELALLGQPDDIDALFAAVRNLEGSHPGSPAAEEAGFTLVRFAHANARRFAAVNPETLLEFSRQARTYADTYPDRVDRAAPVLYAAARSCEKQCSRIADPAMRGRLTNDARLCYIALSTKFPEVNEGILGTAVLRRLNLVGRKLNEFRGPTLDGRFAEIERLRGRVAVVVFWSSENEDFNRQTNRLVSTLSRHANKGVYLLGVNMDANKAAAEEYVRQHRLPGKHIFFEGADKQRWENPLVRYWGVQDIPSMWVVDQYGTVVTTDCAFKNLDERLSSLVKGGSDSGE